MTQPIQFIQTNTIENTDEKLILIISQDIDFVMNLKDSFDQYKISILIATTASKGIEYFHTTNPDLVIIEVSLPDTNGFDVLQEINDLARSRVIPIAITSTEQSRENRIRSYELGATDFIQKPLDQEVFIPLILNRVSFKASIMTKILADELTGAFNRKQFHTTATSLYNRYRTSNESFSIALVDFDLFKAFNLEHGYQKGNDVLVYFVQLAQQILHTKMDVFRFGSDDFVLLFRHKTAVEAAKILLEIADTMKNQWDITFSVGITAWSPATNNNSTLLQQADQALKRAKKIGGDAIFVYEEETFAQPLKSSLKIHIIDDDAIVRAMLERQFLAWTSDTFHINVFSYNDGFEFTESDWFSPNEYHVLLVDGVMPKMDGLEVLHLVKKNFHSERVLVAMLTDRKNDQDILHALNSGADDYMLKPFHPQEVFVRIQRLVNRLFL